jgi:hypothetical protein
MMVSNSTKARVEGTPRGLWLRPSVGWSGARSWVSRHPTRSFMQYKLHLSRMFELRQMSKTGTKP